MNDNTSKYLEDLSRKIIVNGKLEKTSFNFTDAVMFKVEALEKKQVTVYKPLISKTTWVLISIGFLGVFMYTLFFGNAPESTTWLSKIDFSVLSDNALLNTISNFKFSRTLMYAVLFLGFMICVQILFLKNYFNKCFEV